MADEPFSIGGISFDDLGVISCQMDEAASDVASLRLVLNRPIDAARVFDSYENVTLKEGAADRFVGQLDIDATQAAGGSEQNQLVFKSVHQYLDKKDFVQEVYIQSTDSYKNYTLAMLCRGYEVEDDKVTVRKISGRAQLQIIASQLQAAFGIVTTGLASIPDLRPPFFGKSNASLASCLLSVLSWFPCYVVRSRMGSLVIVNTQTSPLRTINLASLAAADQVMTGIAVYPRKDILKSRVEIIYQQMSKGVVVGERRDIATRANGSPYETVRTYQLENGEGFPDDGIAEEYIKWAGVLKLDMEFTLVGGLFWEYNVGDRAQPSAPLPNWGAESTVIQTITRDLLLNTTTIRCGARNHLGLDQMIELNRKNALPPSNDSTGGNDDEGESGTIAVTITGLDDESLATWTAVGPSTTAGAGDGSVEVPVGGYNVVFAIVITEDGRFFAAPAVSGVNVTDGSTEAVAGDYEEKFLGGVHPWKGVVISDTSFRVVPSTIGGHVPPGMEPGSDYIISSAAGKLYGVYNYNTSTGEYGSVELVQSSGDLESTDGTLRMPILQWSTDGGRIVPVNLRETPISVTEPCLQWFASPPKYGRGIS